MLAGHEPDAQRAAAEASTSVQLTGGAQDRHQGLLQGIEYVRETHARLLNSHCDYKGSAGHAKGPRPVPFRKSSGGNRPRAFERCGGDGLQADLAHQHAHLGVGEPAQQPDFWSPSAIGPKPVRTSRSTGEARLGQHAAHDVLAALVQGHLDQVVLAGVLHDAEVVGAGVPVLQLDAVLEPLAQVARERALDGRQVRLLHAVLGGG